MCVCALYDCIMYVYAEKKSCQTSATQSAPLKAHQNKDRNLLWISVLSAQGQPVLTHTQRFPIQVHAIPDILWLQCWMSDAYFASRKHRKHKNATSKKTNQKEPRNIPCNSKLPISTSYPRMVSFSGLSSGSRSSFRLSIGRPPSSCASCHEICQGTRLPTASALIVLICLDHHESKEIIVDS